MSPLLLFKRRRLFTLFVASHMLASWPDTTRAACPLDSASFELITNIRIIRGPSNVDIRLEERYSGEQMRALVKLRARGLADYSSLMNDAKLDSEAATFFYDSRENLSLQYNDGSSACKLVDRDTLLRAAGIYFKPADELSKGPPQEHLIGSARWLKYFCEHRSELKADLSGAPYLVRNVPSVRYTTTLRDEQGTEIDVGVYYSEASLTQEERNNAMPDRIAFHLNPLKSPFVLVDISPVKYITSDQEFVTADSDDFGTNLELDRLLLTPVSCQALIFRAVSPQPIFGHDRIRRVSFSARVAREHHEYTTRVAYDGHLETMRVDLATPRMPVKCSKQIFNFYRNKMYHILEQAHLRHSLPLEQLLEGVNQGPAIERPAVPPEVTTDSNDNLVESLNGADSGASAACSSAPITSMDNYKKLTLAELLLGSNAFMFLGRARVRGIRSLVYGAIGAQLPYWLEPRVEGGAEPPNKLYRPLQYVSHLFLSEVSMNQPDEDSQILMMKIYQMDMDCKFVYQKYTISVYDFSWSLRSVRSACFNTATDDDDDDDDLNNLADLFSLADRCSSSTAAGAITGAADEHGHFELLLESEKPPVAAEGWLAAAPLELQLATLAALQRNLNMMVDMIFSLETKLIGGESDRTKLRMLASFNMARHSNESTHVAYVGQGYRMKGLSLGLPVTCFHQCFMLAAHRRHEVDLAYDQTQNYCYIGLGRAVGLSEAVLPEKRPFELNKLAKLRVYRTRKTLVSQRGVLDSLTDVHHTETKHVRLRDKELAVAPPGCASTVFLIKRLHVRHLFEPTHRLDAATAAFKATDQGDRIEQLAGFGIQEERGVSEAAYMQPDGGQTIQHEEPLSLDQCQALCSANYKCRSISYCIRGAHVECILSLVDLSAPSLAAQIKSQLQIDPSKKIIQVTGQVEPNETRQISLLKQANCAIYNKKFLQYFEHDESAVLTGQHFVSLARAASIEECARLCFNTNLAGLNAHNKLLSSGLARLHEKTDAEQAIIEQLELEGGRIKDCKIFDFIYALQLLELKTNRTLERLNQFATLIGAQISFDNDNEEQLTSPEAGFCLYSTWPRKPSSDEHVQTPRLSFDTDERLEFDRYRFKMASLFDEEHGIRLRSSQLTSEEKEAYDNIRSDHFVEMDSNRQRKERKLDAKSLEIVRRLLRQGENFQELTSGSRQVCARLCFEQLNNLWPACRSFDLYVEMSPEGHSSLKCAMNTMTKRQLIDMRRTDLIDSTSWPAPQARDQKLPRSTQDFWHYEPKKVLLTGQWEQEGEAAVSSLLQHLRGSSSSSSEFIHRELLFLIMATGLALGLYLGVVLMRHAKSQGYLNGQLSARPRRDSISSTRALDLNDQLDLQPIRG